MLFFIGRLNYLEIFYCVQTKIDSILSFFIITMNVAKINDYTLIIL